MNFVLKKVDAVPVVKSLKILAAVMAALSLSNLLLQLIVPYFGGRELGVYNILNGLLLLAINLPQVFYSPAVLLALATIVDFMSKKNDQH
jgi:hypothetical protein